MYFWAGRGFGSGSFPSDIVSSNEFDLYYRGQKIREAWYRGEQIWGPHTVDLRDPVRFFDWTGTLLYSMSATGFLKLNAFPEGIHPDKSWPKEKFTSEEEWQYHNYLTDDGWNYTLEEAKQVVETLGKVDIGAIYSTPNDCEDTIFWVEVPEFNHPEQDDWESVFNIGRYWSSMTELIAVLARPRYSYWDGLQAMIDWGDGVIAASSPQIPLDISKDLYTPYSYQYSNEPKLYTARITPYPLGNQMMFGGYTSFGDINGPSATTNICRLCAFYAGNVFIMYNGIENKYLKYFGATRKYNPFENRQMFRNINDLITVRGITLPDLIENLSNVLRKAFKYPWLSSRTSFYTHTVPMSGASFGNNVLYTFPQNIDHIPESEIIAYSLTGRDIYPVLSNTYFSRVSSLLDIKNGNKKYSIKAVLDSRESQDRVSLMPYGFRGGSNPPVYKNIHGTGNPRFPSFQLYKEPKFDDDLCTFKITDYGEDSNGYPYIFDGIKVVWTDVNMWKNPEDDGWSDEDEFPVVSVVTPATEIYQDIILNVLTFGKFDGVPYKAGRYRCLTSTNEYAYFHVYSTWKPHFYDIDDSVLSVMCTGTILNASKFEIEFTHGSFSVWIELDIKNVSVSSGAELDIRRENEESEYTLNGDVYHILKIDNYFSFRVTQKFACADRIYAIFLDGRSEKNFVPIQDIFFRDPEKANREATLCFYGANEYAFVNTSFYLTPPPQKSGYARLFQCAYSSDSVPMVITGMVFPKPDGEYMDMPAYTSGGNGLETIGMNQVGLYPMGPYLDPERVPLLSRIHINSSKVVKLPGVKIYMTSMDGKETRVQTVSTYNASGGGLLYYINEKGKPWYDPSKPEDRHFYKPSNTMSIRTIRWPEQTPRLPKVSVYQKFSYSPEVKPLIFMIEDCGFTEDGYAYEPVMIECDYPEEYIDPTLPEDAKEFLLQLYPIETPLHVLYQNPMPERPPHFFTMTYDWPNNIQLISPMGKDKDGIYNDGYIESSYRFTIYFTAGCCGEFLHSVTFDGWDQTHDYAAFAANLMLPTITVTKKAKCIDDGAILTVENFGNFFGSGLKIGNLYYVRKDTGEEVEVGKNTQNYKVEDDTITIKAFKLLFLSDDIKIQFLPAANRFSEDELEETLPGMRVPVEIVDEDIRNSTSPRVIVTSPVKNVNETATLNVVTFGSFDGMPYEIGRLRYVRSDTGADVYLGKNTTNYNVSGSLITIKAFKLLFNASKWEIEFTSGSGVDIVWVEVDIKNASQ